MTTLDPESTRRSALAPTTTPAGISARDLVPPGYERRKGRYTARFATTEDELDRACRLRYEVFNVELGEGLEASERTGRDRDEFDAQCQHLIVVETRTDEIVGTYRMQTRESAESANGFYSASEYDLSCIPGDVTDGLVELGRACTSKNHRNSAVILLLWRGMVAYLRHNRKRYFFGCSSLTSQDPAVGLAAHRQLFDSGLVHPTIDVQPHPAYACEVDGPIPRRTKIPKLFAMYLRQGARVCSAPALDRFFGTIDFLTLFDFETADPKVIAQYID